MNKFDSTIAAIATPSGIGGIAVVRISGNDAVKIVSDIIRCIDKEKLQHALSHTVLYSFIFDGEEMIDEVMISVFHAPHSYTGEQTVEIACHGSMFIQQKIMELLIRNGCRAADAGEFTMRAFLNGKLDLSQAEAVADLIASDSQAAHGVALSQMRGGFSKKIKELRQQLIDFAALIELELDFSEEDVEFADRPQLKNLLTDIKKEIKTLIDSFTLGNVIKKGIPVAIIGVPNVGKSTLLNALLNEERALVSEIPGTTRDAIEDTYLINGVSFRFIDTAGLRNTEDTVEQMGIERTYQKINEARVILYLFDITTKAYSEIEAEIKELKKHINDHEERKFILIANKIDALQEAPHELKQLLEHDVIYISAKRKENINLIADALAKAVDSSQFQNKTLVTNMRHYDALQKTLVSVDAVEKALELGVSGDFVAVDIRSALHHLGSITGEVSTEEVLGSVFSKFCIGK